MEIFWAIMQHFDRIEMIGADEKNVSDKLGILYGGDSCASFSNKRTVILDANQDFMELYSIGYLHMGLTIETLSNYSAWPMIA